MGQERGGNPYRDRQGDPESWFHVGSRSIQPQRPEPVQWRRISDPGQNGSDELRRRRSMAKRNRALAKLKKAEARAVEDLALARAKAARKIAKIEAALAAVQRK